MLSIGIYDQDELFREELSSHLKKNPWVTEVVMPRQVGLGARKEAAPDKKLDLVFLKLGSSSEERKKAVSLASELYQNDQNTAVIYLADSVQNWDEEIMLSDVNLAGFMTRPINERILNGYIEKVCSNKQQCSLLSVCVRGKQRYLRVDDILYIESDNHTAHIYMEGQHLVAYEKLSSLKERLPETFIQCHKSFLVNLRHIKSLESDRICLKSGQPIPVSKSQKAAVHRLFLASAQS